MKKKKRGGGKRCFFYFPVVACEKGRGGEFVLLFLSLSEVKIREKKRGK